jgi:hypothetical protein
MLARTIRQHKEFKEIKIGKEEIRVSLFADEVVACTSNPKNSTIELLQLINNFSKVARYKIHSNRSVAFLYMKEKQAEKEIREIIPFTVATNSIKYLGITLTKQVKTFMTINSFLSRKKSKISENGEISHAHDWQN